MVTDKKNVLFIISDQHRYDHMGCSGNSVIQTPYLDKFSQEGIHFSEAFCNSPMCMPSRASLLTGLYPNVHGVRSNGMILSEKIPTLTEILVKEGYQTAAIGKLHHQYNVAPWFAGFPSAESFNGWVFDPIGMPVRENFPLPYYGYQEVETCLGHGATLCGHYLDWLENRAPHLAENMRERWKDMGNFFSVFTDHEIPVELYSSAYVAERTIAFLERHANGEYGDKPFYLHCGFPDPHQPVWPPGKYRTMYKQKDMELPPNFHNIENLRDHRYLGQYINVMPGAMLRESTEKETKKFIAYTYGILSLMDYHIGEILNAVNRLGYHHNTITIYTSDHGDLMGEHGMLFKGPSHGMGVFHIPMIWRIPDLQPAKTNALIAQVDYPITILNLLGINRRKRPDMQGIDMTAVLENPTDPSIDPRNSVLIENDEEVGRLYVRLRHLITKDHKLTMYEGHPGYGDLFNRKKDPWELHNLWNEEKYKELRFQMVTQLLQECLKAQSRLPKRLAGT
ncbi:MAG: sulfatase-like hydrolase/transferase [Candidatus Lokiarchaeota archaeon]|nr:sulfatase-like hydrolase/transferase [Candidatus Lokiarchaeota archaeon]